MICRSRRYTNVFQRHYGLAVQHPGGIRRNDTCPGLTRAAFQIDQEYMRGQDAVPDVELRAGFPFDGNVSILEALDPFQACS